MKTMDCCGVGFSGRADQRRRRVLDSARALFIENGFHATGVAEVAKRSGVAIGQIYRDFGSKENMVVALVEADCGRLMMYETLRAALRDRDTEAVRRWLCDFVEPSDDPDDARLFAEILAEAGRSERIAAIFRTLHDELRRHIDDALALLAPGQASARRRTLTSDVIMTLSMGVFHRQLIETREELSGIVREIQAVLDRELAALAAEPAEH